MASTSSSRNSSSTNPLEENGDVFSMSDTTVSEELDFVEEIGNGNWGSVWLIRPKRAGAASDHQAFKDAGKKFAIKLVHRKKTAANASRIKSLWNEMKIVRTFNKDRHPSIIPFHSFVITPSFAMITMTYVPTPMPVEVEEVKAREWFRFLLSAVDFLHRRGVVHNDIKPANILLTHKNVPVLVDFGFAEKNDVDDDTSFHSNLAYGTPEYLSPERARGLTHDTRKSDVWSLGVTFFEILNGRTPFEEFDGDTLSTKDAVERYWSRTLRGKWVGTWDATPGMEKLLRRMMSPNADLRCTASQALKDKYWPGNDDKSAHSRSSSAVSSLVFEKDLDKLLNMSPPVARVRRTVDTTETNVPEPVSPPGLEVVELAPSPTSSRHSLVKKRSQPQVSVSHIPPRKRGVIPPIMDLSPIKASPPSSPHTAYSTSAKAKENVSTPVAHHSKAAAGQRRAFGAVLSPENRQPQATEAIKPPPALSCRIPIKTLDEMTNKQRPGLFDSTRSRTNLARSRTSSRQNINSTRTSREDLRDTSGNNGMRTKMSSTVNNRVLEWEKEKQRLREMERLETLERERDEHFSQEKARRRERKEQRRKSEEEELNKNVDERGENDGDDGDAVAEESRVSELASSLTEPVQLVATMGSKRSKKAYINGNKENAGTPDQQRRQNQRLTDEPPMLPLPPVMSPFSRLLNTFPAPSPNSSMHVSQSTEKQQKNKNIFKHGIKASIDKTVQFCKANSISRASGPPNDSMTAGRTGPSFDLVREVEKTGSKIRRESREEIRDAKAVGQVTTAFASIASPIAPVGAVKSATVIDQATLDSQRDRLSLWMKSVEQVVEETQANFEAMASRDCAPPPLPVPITRSQPRASRTTRLPRRVLAASQIFDENGMQNPKLASPPPPSSWSGEGPQRRRSESSVPTQDAPSDTSPLHSAIGNAFVIPEIVTPSKQRQGRRVSVSTGSPVPMVHGKFVENMNASASTSDLNFSSKEFLTPRRPQSHANLARPVANKGVRSSSDTFPKLADVVDRNLFIAPPYTSRDNLLDYNIVPVTSLSYDDLTASPYQVEAYPARRPSADVSYLDTPDRMKMENVYDRFLMTSGVKRNGKGYQSELFGPVSNTLAATHSKRESFRPFGGRRPMPPPVSSEDILVNVEKVDNMDESGSVPNADGELVSSLHSKDGTVSLVRRAFKAMVPGRTVSGRSSRAF